ncbi:hypothetical protein D3C81_491800 [compost metagenome]
MTRPMGQHQGFCLTVNQTAMTPRVAANSSSPDMEVPWVNRIWGRIVTAGSGIWFEDQKIAAFGSSYR